MPRLSTLSKTSEVRHDKVRWSNKHWRGGLNGGQFEGDGSTSRNHVETSNALTATDLRGIAVPADIKECTN